MNVNTH